jgi:hypothetical protein
MAGPSKQRSGVEALRYTQQVGLAVMIKISSLPDNFKTYGQRASAIHKVK